MCMYVFTKIEAAVAEFYARIIGIYFEPVIFIFTKIEAVAAEFYASIIAHSH